MFVDDYAELKWKSKEAVLPHRGGWVRDLLWYLGRSRFSGYLYCRICTVSHYEGGDMLAKLLTSLLKIVV